MLSAQYQAIFLLDYVIFRIKNLENMILLELPYRYYYYSLLVSISLVRVYNNTIFDRISDG